MPEGIEQLSHEIEETVRAELDLRAAVSDLQIEQAIDRKILRKTEERYIPLKEKIELKERIFSSIRGLDCLAALMNRTDITEIMINDYHKIFVERNGQIERWDGGFTSEEKYMDVIQQVAARCNRIVNESSPIVDARLSDGSRVNVVLPPVALDGAVMTIRRFPERNFNAGDLVERGMLSEELVSLLRILVKSRYNILISGGTGSGKTTFLNVMADFIPKTERIITIEDSAELKLQSIENLVRLEVRNANVEGKNAVHMKDLIRSSLRMRPTRIIVGEVRGEEALDMLQAMNAGHDGSLSTGHANSARDMLYRLETMVLMGIEMPLAAIRQQIASAIDIIVHIGRLADGRRKVLEITEVQGMQEGEVQLHTLCKYQNKILEKEKTDENWEFKEAICHMEKLETAGCLEEYQTLYRTGISGGSGHRDSGMPDSGMVVL